MQPQIKIIVVDNHAILRDGLKLILEQDKALAVLCCATDTAECIAYTKRFNPDVVVVGLMMDNMQGIEAINLIKEHDTSIKVLALSHNDNPVYIRQAIEAGANGYLNKTASVNKIIEAIKMLHKNMSVFDEGVIRMVQQYETMSLKFTKRERQVIKKIVEGKTNKAIAAELELSEGTVKNIVSCLLDKIGIASRTQLVTFAISKLPDIC